MNWRRIFFIVFVLLVAWYIISNPGGAAAMVGNVADWLKNAFTSVVAFLQSSLSAIFN